MATRGHKNQGSLYNRWSSMKQRCLNPNCYSYENYGGRGIILCDKWVLFEGFKEDMREGYLKELSLDRIDNNKGYYKANCRWADKITQNNNTTRNRYIEYKGITKTISEWAKISGLKSSTFRQRFYCMGWDIERCLTTKLK